MCADGAQPLDRANGQAQSVRPNGIGDSGSGDPESLKLDAPVSWVKMLAAHLDQWLHGSSTLRYRVLDSE